MSVLCGIIITSIAVDGTGAVQIGSASYGILVDVSRGLLVTTIFGEVVACPYTVGFAVVLTEGSLLW